MKIALLGYGKMGKTLETLAPQRGHTICVTIDNEEEWSTKASALQHSDLAIDFSMPSTVVANIRRCLNMRMPIVVGTTGWYDQLDALVEECRRKEGAMFVASNFSIGMNIMFDLNRRLAQLMNRYSEYHVSVCETHHVHKLDAPSGTAITLANDIVRLLDSKDGWQLESTTRTDPVTGAETVEAGTMPMKAGTVPICSYRLGEDAGTHEVKYDSMVDTLTLRHSAKSRQGLAVGAILAAEFLHAKVQEGGKGYFTMQQLLEE